MIRTELVGCVTRVVAKPARDGRQGARYVTCVDAEGTEYELYVRDSDDSNEVLGGSSYEFQLAIGTRPEAVASSKPGGRPWIRQAWDVRVTGIVAV